MNTNTAEGNQSYPHDRRSTVNKVTEFVEVVSEGFAELGADNETVEAVEEVGGEMVEEIESELGKKDSQIQELQEQLSDERDKRSADVEGCHSRISELKQDIDDVNPTPEADQTTIQADDLTPIEQLSQADDVSEVTDSTTVQRAVSLFKNLDSWGSRTPKGIVLKPVDNPLSLLEADQNESLCWKQYYRAAEALEQLSQGSVTFFNSDRHGKMICLHEQSEAYQRVVNGTLSASSVGAEG